MGGETEEQLVPTEALLADAPNAPDTAEAAAARAPIALTLATSMESDSVAHNTARKLLSLATVGAPQYEVTDRAPIDIVCVIDVSGSMRGDKLDACKKTLAFVISQLRDADRLAIVLYSTEVRVGLELTCMDAVGKERGRQCCRGIAATDQTNLSGGLLRGLEIMQSRPDKRSVSSLLLMTDGLANVGLTKTPEIEEAIKPIIAQQETTTVYTFGFGEDHDAVLLRGISDVGKGMYYYIKTVEDIPGSFGDCLGGLLATVAQNIKLSFKCVAPEYKLTNVLTKRPITWSENRDSCDVDMGDLQSGEDRDILVEIDVPCNAEANAEAVTIVQVGLQYFNVIEKKFDSAQCEMKLARPELDPEATVASAAAAHPRVREQHNRVRAADAIVDAKRLADSGSLEPAVELLTKLIDEMQLGSCSQLEGELVDDLKHCRTLMSDRLAYSKGGSHTCMNYSQTHSYQRCNVVSHPRGYSSYVTSAKNHYVTLSKTADDDEEAD